MKITEYRGEDAIDLLADILEPVGEIIGDPEVEKIFQGFQKSSFNRELIKHVLKNHKRALIEIMARLDNEPVEQYRKKVNIFTLPKKALELLDDEELISFFVSQGLKTGNEFSGSAMENIVETETE